MHLFSFRFWSVPFPIVVVRVTLVLLLCTLCFLSRVIMLALKMAALHGRGDTVTSPAFSLFGLLWFTFADFIPRSLPSAVCLFLLTLRKPGGHSGKADTAQQPLSSLRSAFDEDERKDATAASPIAPTRPGTTAATGSSRRGDRYSSHRRQEQAVYQFVRLAGDEMDLEYSPRDMPVADNSNNSSIIISKEDEAFSTDAAPHFPISSPVPTYSPLAAGGTGDGDRDRDMDKRHWDGEWNGEDEDGTNDLRRSMLPADMFAERFGDGYSTDNLNLRTGRSLLWTGDLDEDEDDDGEKERGEVNGSRDREAEDDDDEDSPSRPGPSSRGALNQLLFMLSKEGQSLDIEQLNQPSRETSVKHSSITKWIFG